MLERDKLINNYNLFIVQTRYMSTGAALRQKFHDSPPRGALTGLQMSRILETRWFIAMSTRTRQ
jgi:hypothetical protein